MDLLAAIASDPTTLPLWAVALFAASMYPVGMLFGCSPCCNVCRLCCRDEVGQVVVDFALEGTGEQLVKATPFGLRLYNGGSATFDSKGATEYDIPHVPMFIVEGQTSGARHLYPPADNGDGTFSPWFNGPQLYSATMGSASRSAFVDGESVTVTPVPAATEVSAPGLTAIVTDCPGPFVGFEGDSGRWQPTDTASAPAVDLNVDCQGDEGTIVFDVVDQRGRAPGPCEACNISVERSMAHPASFLLSPCGSGGLANLRSLSYEKSNLSVSVPLMELGPATCGEEIVATAVTSWNGVISNGGFCGKTTTYTLTPADQDCVPFSAWPSESTDPTVAFDEQLITLSTPSLPCLGFGFQGRAVQPAGIPGADDGPITEVEVISGGSGYAVLGRVEPTVTISAASGSGADFAVTMADGFVDNCGRPVWAIDSVSIGPGGGGSGYVDGSPLFGTVDSPGIQYAAAALVARCVREEPEVVLSGGTSDLTIAFTENAVPPKTWTVDTVTVVDGGSGYEYGQIYSFVGKTSSDKADGIGYGQVTTLVEEPTITLSGGTGSGAVLGVTLASNGGAPETWGIDAVTITGGGLGYLVDDELTVDIAAGDVQVTAAVVTVSSVDGSGAITGISIPASGAFYHETGELETVSVWFSGGGYFRDSGELESVDVSFGGGYYLEDASVPALVADVPIEIHQLSPSNGSGAEISAVVDDDPSSPTFGQITGLTIEAGGTNYLARHHQDGICGGPGGVWRGSFSFCGVTADESTTAVPRGVLFRRGCPDYIHEITLQAP